MQDTIRSIRLAVMLRLKFSIQRAQRSEGCSRQAVLQDKNMGIL